MALDRLGCFVFLVIPLTVLVSCAPSTMGGISASPQLLTQADTINLEASDRISRFGRLAQLEGIPPPQIEQVYAPAGTVPGVNRPVPVVRVTFEEGVFFNTDKDVPIPSSIPVIALIAQNMSKDVPDAALTIIGNTDSTGTDAYNDGLSARRALNVMKLLASEGVDPLQMTTVAVGDRQPVAPNSTPEGRARNRRVEFLISASPQANLAVVQYQHVNASYFSTGTAAPAPARSRGTTVTVLQAHPVLVSGAKQLALRPLGSMQIEPAADPAGPPVADRPLAPAPIVTEREPTPIAPAAPTDIVAQ